MGFILVGEAMAIDYGLAVSLIFIAVFDLDDAVKNMDDAV